MKKIIIGSRKSMLAKIQAYEVGKTITEYYPDISIEYKTIDSDGDQNQQKNLSAFSSTGIFTKCVTNQLIDHTIDCAVHSWKDLPTIGEPETEIIATLKRADPHDILFLNRSALDKPELTILTSSPRREVSIRDFLSWGLPWNPSRIELKPVRGNVDTRLRKLTELAEGDGLILAKAGIERLLSDLNSDEEFKSSIRELLAKTIKIILPLDTFPSAPGQGALAIEILKTNDELASILNKINHLPTFEAVNHERKFLRQHGGGCHSKLGACSIPHPAGTIFFSQRSSPDETSLIKECRFINKNAATAQPASPGRNTNLFSFSLLQADTLRVEREEKITASPSTGFFITKDSAITDSCLQELKQNNSLVWTSGIKTWKKLAAKGVMVAGCFDSLGDRNPPQISNLYPRIKNWLKLTNASGNPVDWAEPVFTYKVELPAVKDLSVYDQFYWSSFSEFEQCYKTDKSILAKSHSCGAGSTYDKLSGLIPADRLKVFLSHDEWLKHFS